MEISPYLAENKLTQNEFALRIGRSQSYVTRLKKQQLRPSLLETLVVFNESECKINIPDILPISVLKERNLLNNRDEPSIYLVKI